MIGEALHRGLSITEALGNDVLYRYANESDDIEGLTAMLHEAYSPLAEAGMRFVASYQDVDTTRRRMAKGETIVAIADIDTTNMPDVIVGVITLTRPGDTVGSPFYDRRDVASFGQFAVRPSHQGRGIGGVLMRLVEDRARECGASMIGLDTSERATRLIDLYERRGYRFLEYAQWKSVNYRSVVLAKQL